MAALQQKQAEAAAEKEKKQAKRAADDALLERVSVVSKPAHVDVLAAAASTFSYLPAPGARFKEAWKVLKLHMLSLVPGLENILTDEPVKALKQLVSEFSSMWGNSGTNATMLAALRHMVCHPQLPQLPPPKVADWADAPAQAAQQRAAACASRGAGSSRRRPRPDDDDEEGSSEHETAEPSQPAALAGAPVTQRRSNRLAREARIDFQMLNDLGAVDLQADVLQALGVSLPEDEL